MPISAGVNIVRIGGHRLGRSGIYDIIKFILVNRSRETYEIAFATPAGGHPAKIVVDLIEIMKADRWVSMYLKEQNGMLAISSIREPEISQAELSAWGPKVLVH